MSRPEYLTEVSKEIQEALGEDWFNEASQELIQQILNIPGVYDAVMKAATDHWVSTELKVLKNDGIDNIADIPFYFIWMACQDDL